MLYAFSKNIKGKIMKICSKPLISILLASCIAPFLSAAQLAKKPQLTIKTVPEAVV
jgi:hypothetical protein